MNYSTIRYRLDGRTAIVTFTRPERRNALNDLMIRELTELLHILGRSQDSRSVILTGEGEAFCAGMDIDYLRTSMAKNHEENVEDARNLTKLLTVLHTLKKPVIAAVHGAALGGGCGIAAACDFVLAARDSTRIGVPEVRIGFVPAVILKYLILRLGYTRARELSLQGKILTASEGMSYGLISEVVDDTTLLHSALELGERLAVTTSASSLSLTKELFTRVAEMGEKEAAEYACNLNALTRKTDDFKRGIESFLKKEKLRW